MTFCIDELTLTRICAHRCADDSISRTALSAILEGAALTCALACVAPSRLLLVATLLVGVRRKPTNSCSIANFSSLHRQVVPWLQMSSPFGIDPNNGGEMPLGCRMGRPTVTKVGPSCSAS